MYARHAVFGEDRRGFEEGRFWFQDGLHAAEPLYPFDSIAFEYAMVAFNQASSRLFVVPPSLGAECRLLNGYVYLSANLVTDEPTLARRAELYAGRGGYYFEHWNELYQRWLERVEAATRDLVELEVPEMHELEDESIVTEGGGLGSSHALLQAYDRLIEGVDRIFQHHFEFLNLGYAAYLVFYERCRQAFPDISDQTIATMVSAIDVLVLRPDDELRRLARLAFELGVSEQVASAENEEELVAALADSDPGERWLADFEQTKDPWFYFSCGTGVFHHHHRSWIDDTRLPIQTIGSYIARLDAGEDIARPAESMLAERERVTEEHRALVSRRSCARASTRASRSRERSSPTSRTTTSTSTTGTSRSSGTRCASSVRSWRAVGFLADGEDVFLLRHDEVRSALEALRLDWSSGGAGVPHGPLVWPPLVERRRAIYHAMCAWAQPPALGPLHEEITDPIIDHALGDHGRARARLALVRRRRSRDTDRVSGIPRRGRGLGTGTAAGGPAR